MKLTDDDKRTLEVILAHVTRRLSGLNCRVREVRGELPKKDELHTVDRYYLVVYRADLDYLLTHEVDPMVDEWLKTLDGKHYLIVYEPVLLSRGNPDHSRYRVRNIAVQGQMTWDESAMATRISVDFYVAKIAE